MKVHGRDDRLLAVTAAGLAVVLTGAVAVVSFGVVHAQTRASNESSASPVQSGSLSEALSDVATRRPGHAGAVATPAAGSPVRQSPILAPASPSDGTSRASHAVPASAPGPRTALPKRPRASGLPPLPPSLVAPGPGTSVSLPVAASPASSTVAPACATPGDAQPWPAGTPPLPVPPGAVMDSVSQQDRLTIVRFSTPDGLRPAILWLLTDLPAAGYVVGRGDAEASEADAPFTGSGLNGIFRMYAVDNCKTSWLLAYTGTYAGPVGTPAASPTASALPFS